MFLKHSWSANALDAVKKSTREKGDFSVLSVTFTYVLSVIKKSMKNVLYAELDLKKFKNIQFRQRINGYRTSKIA